MARVAWVAWVAWVDWVAWVAWVVRVDARLEERERERVREWSGARGSGA